MDNISENVNTIIAHRQPLSTKAKKLYETVQGAGGFLQTYTITFSKAIGIRSTGQNEFIKYLDECIEKDYIRVIFKDNPKEKNGFFTFEYFYRDVLPRLEQRNFEAYQSHIEYIAYKLQEVLSEKELH